MARALAHADPRWYHAKSLQPVVDDGHRRVASEVVSALVRDGWRPHYLSTACYHAAADQHRDQAERERLHQRCQLDTTRFDGSHKVAAECKWGQEPCLCECHADSRRGPTHELLGAAAAGSVSS